MNTQNYSREDRMSLGDIEYPEIERRQPNKNKLIKSNGRKRASKSDK